MIIKILSIFSLWITINSFFVPLIDRKTKYNDYGYMSVKLTLLGFFFGIFMLLFIKRIRYIRKEQSLYSKYIHLRFMYDFPKEYIDHNHNDELYKEYISLKRHFAIKKFKKFKKLKNV